MRNIIYVNFPLWEAAETMISPPQSYIKFRFYKNVMYIRENK